MFPAKVDRVSKYEKHRQPQLFPCHIKSPAAALSFDAEKQPLRTKHHQSFVGSQTQTTWRKPCGKLRGCFRKGANLVNRNLDGSIVLNTTTKATTSSRSAVSTKPNKTRSVTIFSSLQDFWDFLSSFRTKYYVISHLPLLSIAGEALNHISVTNFLNDPLPVPVFKSFCDFFVALLANNRTKYNCPYSLAKRKRDFCFDNASKPSSSGASQIRKKIKLVSPGVGTSDSFFTNGLVDRKRPRSISSIISDNDNFKRLFKKQMIDCVRILGISKVLEIPKVQDLAEGSSNVQLVDDVCMSTIEHEPKEEDISFLADEDEEIMWDCLDEIENDLSTGMGELTEVFRIHSEKTFQSIIEDKEELMWNCSE